VTHTFGKHSIPVVRRIVYAEKSTSLKVISDRTKATTDAFGKRPLNALLHINPFIWIKKTPYVKKITKKTFKGLFHKNAFSHSKNTLYKGGAS
jgi:hypothetical protein